MFEIIASLNQDMKKQQQENRNNVYMNGVHFYIEN